MPFLSAIYREIGRIFPQIGSLLLTFPKCKVFVCPRKVPCQAHYQITQRITYDKWTAQDCDVVHLLVSSILTLRLQRSHFADPYKESFNGS